MKPPTPPQPHPLGRVLACWLLAAGHRAGGVAGGGPRTGHRARRRWVLSQPLRCEVQARAKDGREYWIGNDIQPLHDAQGALSGFMEARGQDLRAAP